jgi:hypothetical protein
MTTTQIKQAGSATHTTGATCSVTNASPTVTSTAGDFVASDIGRTITSVSTSGKKVLSIQSAFAMTMDGNATASTGPQTVAMAAALVNVTKKTNGYTDKTSTYLTTLPVGSAHLAQQALNVWINCGGTGTHATRCQKELAAQGLVVQET